MILFVLLVSLNIIQPLVGHGPIELSYKPNSTNNAQNIAKKPQVHQLINQYAPKTSYHSNSINSDHEAYFISSLADFKLKPTRLSYGKSKPEFFKNWLANMSNNQIFHKFRCYQYLGFKKHVESLQGFEEFILSLDQSLHKSDTFKKSLLWGESDRDKVEHIYGYLNSKYHEINTRNKVDALHKHGLDDTGVQLLKNYKLLDSFIYSTNHLQSQQLNKIFQQVNDLSKFKQKIHAHDYEINALCEESFNFTNFANNANRANLLGLSQQLLDVGEQFLAVAKGFAIGVYSNLSTIAHMAIHPVDTIYGLGRVAGNIGVGILRALTICEKAFAINFTSDSKSVSSYQQDVARYADEWRDFYETIKHEHFDKLKYISKSERCELIGERAVDIAFLIYGSELLAGAKSTTSWTKLAATSKQITPRVFSKLGEFGRQINRTVGSALANSKKYLQSAGEFELVAGEAGAFSGFDIVNKKNCDCLISNLAHDVIQYENLKSALQIKEFTSIINVTKHGLQRLIERGFTPSDVKELMDAPDFIKNQLDSAKAFIKCKDINKYNLIVYNRDKESVITAFKNISKDKVVNLGKNYGWEL